MKMIKNNLHFGFIILKIKIKLKVKKYLFKACNG